MTLAVLIAIASTCPPAQSGKCRFDLVSENAAIAPGKPFWIAGRFRIEPGWHIYWINPGEAGLPSGIDWRLPPGFSLLEVRWPVPILLSSQGAWSYGYEGEIAVLAKIMPARNVVIGKRASIRALADWMACSDMCVTGQASAQRTVTVASSPRVDPSASRAFLAYRAALPESGANLRPFVYEGNSRLRLEVMIPNYGQAKSMTFFPAKSGVTPASGEQAATFGRTSMLVMDKLAGFRPTTYLEGVLSVEYSQNKRRAFYVNAPYKTP